VKELDEALSRERQKDREITELKRRLAAVTDSSQCDPTVRIPRVQPESSAGKPVAQKDAGATRSVLSPQSFFQGEMRGPKAYRSQMPTHVAESTSKHLNFEWEPSAIASRIASIAFLHHLFLGARQYLRRVLTSGEL